MAHVHHVQPIPRGMIIASAVLISTAMLFAGVARLTDIGATRLASEARTEQLLLRFADLGDGGIAVTGDPGGALVRKFSVGEGGFVRVVLRTLAQKRAAVHIGNEAPFRLARLESGQLILEDPATGNSVLLRAFGPGNAAVFEELMEKGRQPS